ncbi:transcription factor bHLH150-like [Miscanthus floridulus]|uniref:transcription factor bHLH150-like n=1 Tax=Miscanthus floridulus TaxID=154761 RepID=UPI0034578C3A
MISSPSPSPSSSRTPKGGSTTPPPRSQASKWRSGAVRGVYGRRLLDALRATGGGQPRAVKAAADSALALTARGQTRWSRAILLAGAACSRRRVLVKAGGKVRRRRRPPLPVQARDNAAAAALLKGKGKEKDKVQERLRVLGRLVPGCRKLPAPALLEEAADYVAALQMQVSAMRALTDALAAAQLSSPADADAEAEAGR